MRKKLAQREGITHLGDVDHCVRPADGVPLFTNFNHWGSSVKNLESKRAGWAVLLVIAVTAVAATVFVSTGAAGKSSLTYVNVGAAAFITEDSACGVTPPPTAPTLHARLAQQAGHDFNHDGYSGALVDEDGCDYVAHIDLPDGMRIGSITAYYNNDEADATFRFEASDDFGNHDDLVDDSLDGSAGEEGGAVCDGSDNCWAIWDLNEKISNTSTHYGIYLDASGGTGFVLYRFKIKIKSP